MTEFFFRVADSGSDPWKLTTAFRGSPARAMDSTTFPPKQYPMAAIRF